MEITDPRRGIAAKEKPGDVTKKGTCYKSPSSSQIISSRMPSLYLSKGALCFQDRPYEAVKYGLGAKPYKRVLCYHLYNGQSTLKASKKFVGGWIIVIFNSIRK